VSNVKHDKDFAMAEVEVEKEFQEEAMLSKIWI
jgi:hypothetical protein